MPARVDRLLPNDGAIVAIAGVEMEISLALVDEVAVGDYVVVHVGYALSRIDPEEAQKTLELFAELAAVEEDLAPPDPDSRPPSSEEE